MRKGGWRFRPAASRRWHCGAGKRTAAFRRTTCGSGLRTVAVSALYLSTKFAHRVSIQVSRLVTPQGPGGPAEAPAHRQARALDWWRRRLGRIGCRLHGERSGLTNTQCLSSGNRTQWTVDPRTASAELISLAGHRAQRQVSRMVPNTRVSASRATVRSNSEIADSILRSTKETDQPQGLTASCTVVLRRVSSSSLHGPSREATVEATSKARTQLQLTEQPAVHLLLGLLARCFS